jgi:hypothetical protein
VVGDHQSSKDSCSQVSLCSACLSHTTVLRSMLCSTAIHVLQKLHLDTLAADGLFKIFYFLFSRFFKDGAVYHMF